MSNENNVAFDIRDLEAFASVMATGSMTGAARQLGIGQPAVTRMIKDLETAIGFGLFTRNGPRISPTPKGVQFFEDARQLLASFGQVAQRAANLRDDSILAITLAATPTMAAGLAPLILQELGAALPPTIGIPTMDAEHVAQALHSGAANYGLCALPLAHADLECLVSARAGLVAVLPPDLPPEPLKLEVFRERRLLTVGNSYRIRHAINAALSAQGVAPPAEMTTNCSINAITAARAGLGIALVDCISAYGIDVRGVTVVPLQTEIPYEWGLFRRSGGAIAELEAPLCESFRSASQRLGATWVSEL